MKHKTRTGFEPRTLRLTTGSVVTYLALLWFFTTGCLLGQLAKFKDIGFFARRHLSRRRLVLKRSARPFSRWHLWWRLVGGFVKMSFGRNVRLQESGRLKTWWHFNWDSSTKSPSVLIDWKIFSASIDSSLEFNHSDWVLQIMWPLSTNQSDWMSALRKLRLKIFLLHWIQALN